VSDQDRVQLFDRWAERYDRSVQSATGLHEGYEEVLDLVVQLADAQSGMRVLDLGVGTGNLARRFVALGCAVWGVDFSPAMLDKARAKVPEVRFVQMDLRQEAWPDALAGQRFERIVSTYVFHEFDLKTKVRILTRLVHEHLAAQGRIVVGDVAFADRQALERAGADHWDEDEHYWVADEAIAACEGAGLGAVYTQASSCGGVLVVKHSLQHR
jgi:putative AdoMet-dependent methyltransferase